MYNELIRRDKNFDYLPSSVRQILTIQELTKLAKCKDCPAVDERHIEFLKDFLVPRRRASVLFESRNPDTLKTVQAFNAKANIVSKGPLLMGKYFTSQLEKHLDFRAGDKSLTEHIVRSNFDYVQSLDEMMTWLMAFRNDAQSCLDAKFRNASANKISAIKQSLLDHYNENGVDTETYTVNQARLIGAFYKYAAKNCPGWSKLDENILSHRLRFIDNLLESPPPKSIRFHTDNQALRSTVERHNTEHNIANTDPLPMKHYFEFILGESTELVRPTGTISKPNESISSYLYQNGNPWD